MPSIHLPTPSLVTPGLKRRCYSTTPRTTLGTQGRGDRLLRGGSSAWIRIGLDRHVCIDKSSSAELSEAINSMFHCYQNSEICYVFITDLCRVARSMIFAKAAGLSVAGPCKNLSPPKKWSSTTAIRITGDPEQNTHHYLGMLLASQTGFFLAPGIHDITPLRIECPGPPSEK
ncbi:hypothetical protein B0T14DRAFT_588101 [Immersiella caudata]|uniref:Uncharacterized protein n=1 Tax=Immersiella caudata TaxID=314043 RepID=A0AA40BWI8_9PEZI|nr:hypothetical protein B0T14DRAFT_588101 [Immersiella caudata]